MNRRPFSTAAADSSAPGTGTAPRSPGPAGHRAAVPTLALGAENGTGHWAPEPHRESRGSHGHRLPEPARELPGRQRAPAPGTGTSIGAGTGTGTGHRAEAPSGRSPGTGTSPGHRAGSRPVSRGRRRGTGLGCRHRAPFPRPAAPRPGASPGHRAPRSVSQGTAAVSPPVDRAGPPHRIPVPLSVRGGHRLPGPGGDTRGAEPPLYQRRRPAGRAFGRRERR